MTALLGWLAAANAEVPPEREPSGPSLWTRASWAACVNPTGVLAEGTAELRAPILRFGGVAFNDTFVGAGARVAVSPAHADLAARISLQPIDLLPITVEAVHTTYWESPWGLVPVDRVERQRTPDRRPLYQADRDFYGTADALIVSPTLQARAGPIVAFTNPVFTWIRVRPEQAPEPWVYEPFRGMVMAYDDRLLEHTSAVLWEPRDGEDGALFRVGPAFRGKSSAVTGDATLTLGGVMQWRPGRETTAPTILVLATPYLRDPDYAGALPFVAALLTFERDDPLRSAR